MGEWAGEARGGHQRAGLPNGQLLPADVRAVGPVHSLLGPRRPVRHLQAQELWPQLHIHREQVEQSNIDYKLNLAQGV